ncbi:MAG: DUF881 domain-containing protein [Eubacteriales bacterium]|nr:DUF881 domain-containing protein [Eubacteriales bacterium]
MTLDKTKRSIALALVCLSLGIILAWQYKSINNSETASGLENLREDQLKDELIQLQDDYADMLERFTELKNENEEIKEQGMNENDIRDRLNKELVEVKTFAGMLDVMGAGLRINMKEGSTFSIQDDDLLQLINELRAADAQAISINDERIVAMTEIRSVSSLYIMINGNRYTSPYEIKAIGDPQKMENSLNMIGGVMDDFKGLDFQISIEKSDSIVIGGVKDDGSVIKTDLLIPVDKEK